jgi:Tol biopolymer transport system component
MAAPFDVHRQVVTGSAVPIVDGVMQAVNVGSVVLNNTGAAQFSFSDSDALVYVPGGIGSDEGLGVDVVWVGRDGRTEHVPLPRRRYGGLRLSSAGDRFVTFTGGLPTPSVWVYDFARGTMIRLTTEGEAVWPIWSPGESRVTFLAAALPNAKPGISSLPVDGGSIEPLTGVKKAPLYGLPASWSHDGKLLAYLRNTAEVNWEIRILSVSDGRDERLLPARRTPCLERYPAFAPEGQWIAYATDESGRDEVYVQRYPSGERRLLSSDGGVSPAWSRNGRELFYTVVRPEGLEMMAVDLTLGSAFKASRPRRLFAGP